MVATDIRRRAIPWSRLILETGQIPDDLNLRRGQRLSAALVGMLCMLVPLVLVWSQAILGALSILGAVIALNRGLFLFFFRRHGVGFALACVPLHLLYFLYSALSYLGVWVTLKLRLAVARSAR
jgi:hypothetical protein